MNLNIHEEADMVEVTVRDHIIRVEFTDGHPSGISLSPVEEEVPPVRPGRTKPLACEPANEIKPHRPGTRRATVIALLRRGTTIEEIAKATRWGRNDVREAIRQIHRDLGYGIEERADGQLSLLSEATTAA
jgi:hypothetical protein